ncbi:MAG: hypothetical protein HYY93_02640 [Planctomycetes bacterium]|nr:hypothetical protein [Planctomycetota bacterium]
MARAVCLMSGGLDSTLAALVTRRAGADIIGVNFSTGFCVFDHKRAMNLRKKDGGVYNNMALWQGAVANVPVEVIDVRREYIEIVKNPAHGYGKHMNPCIDCRIFMLAGVRQALEQFGAQFVVTGEVLNQRPMSQHRSALDMIEKDARLKGLLLRPLSAKLLPATIPEEKGWVDRGKLYGIKGRSRREQMSIAAEFGLTEFMQPAGGCCALVDDTFSGRLRDLFASRGKEHVTADDLPLLKVGRHFRLHPGLKAIIGRDEHENNFLQAHFSSRWTFETIDVNGPVAVHDGVDPTPEERERIAAMVARYSDGRTLPEIAIQVTHAGVSETLRVAPARDEVFEGMRV